MSYEQISSSDLALLCTLVDSEHNLHMRVLPWSSLDFSTEASAPHAHFTAMTIVPQVGCLDGGAVMVHSPYTIPTHLAENAASDSLAYRTLFMVRYSKDEGCMAQCSIGLYFFQKIFGGFSLPRHRYSEVQRPDGAGGTVPVSRPGRRDPGHLAQDPRARALAPGSLPEVRWISALSVFSEYRSAIAKSLICMHEYALYESLCIRSSVKDPDTGHNAHRRCGSDFMVEVSSTGVAGQHSG